ncbi:MAG: hypothetical protein IJ501_00210 [Bacilli bacterium]|nr:hypothetical protein [Bacilli bacterium]
MCNESIQRILEIVITILNLIKFVVPIILIIFCTIDIFKIIVTKKEDEIKRLRKDIFIKIFCAIIIYLIPFLIAFILNLVDDLIPMDYDNSWKYCWDLVEKREKFN